MALLGAVIQGPITLIPLKVLFLVASFALVSNLLPFNPISAFYSALRAPIHAFNDFVESSLINRISLGKCTAPKNILANVI